MFKLSCTHTIAFQGLEAVPVYVEVDLSPADELVLTLVGLPTAAVKESKDRVIAALKNVKHPLTSSRCTVNLAPADLKKEGAFYDLPIALGVLGSMGKIAHPERIADYLAVGELGLGGEVRGIKGALSVAMLAKKMGKKGVIVPAQNKNEALLVSDLFVVAVKDLNELISFFEKPEEKAAVRGSISPAVFEESAPPVDFSDIKGQEHVKRAMEIAAAGGHNILLFGPPGTGKTMLAKSFIGILPPLTAEGALEVTKIHSIAGMLPQGKSMISERPFRSPHHTVSYAGLIGGGAHPRPGEVTLAHHGVLFLDELPEFSRQALEVLRQPLEDKKVTISRANGNITYPSSFICIAAMNPCPCGYLGHPEKPCRDTKGQIDRYRGKISGPIWDRMDMHVEVPSLSFNQIMQKDNGECSSEIKKRVLAARKGQKLRFGLPRTNAQMSKQELKTFAELNASCQKILQQAVDVMGVSARALDKLIRVARTIADLSFSEKIQTDHLMEALSYRNLS